MPDEVKFLRKYLGFSTDDFAAKLSVRAQDVMRWETNGNMPHAAETTLRILAATSDPLTAYPPGGRVQRKLKFSRREGTEDGWTDQVRATG